MRRFLILIAVLGPSGLWSCSSAIEPHLPAPEASERSATIESVLSEIQAGVDGAHSRLQRSGTCAYQCPQLDEVVVTLQAVLKRVGNSGFRFLILSFGRRIESSQVQTVVLTLKPPPTDSGKAKKGPTLSTLLSEAIVDAVQGVQRAEVHDTVPLELETFTVDIGFVVSVVDAAGVDGPRVSILPIDIDFENSGSLTSGNTHRARVSFSRSDLSEKLDSFP